ncbi:hypothetical protein AAUPMB_21432, partial [Pasteurella multocida subsp. multocida str. Anand1_buffalo]
VDPNTKVKELGLGQQQLVEIAKALNKKFVYLSSMNPVPH